MPPSRLRRYDLFLIDEASQIDDHIAQLLLIGLGELPQKPFVAIAADFRQLRPVGGGFYDAVDVQRLADCQSEDYSSHQ